MNTSEDYHKHQTPQAHQQHPEMDYTAYFAPPPISQPYHFMSLPPTPARTQPVTSEEYSNESPPGSFDFQFDAYGNFNATALHHPQPPTPQSSNGTGTSLPPATNDNLAHEAFDNNGEQKGSNSDGDEEATPALSRRKAQNRAAQRAFRERKERHVKELEAQVAALKQASEKNAADNERLKLNIQKLATENEILKATSQHHSSHGPSPALPDAGPMRFNPKDFYRDVLHSHENKTPSHRIITDQTTGSRLLAVGATWDYIIAHPLFKKGLVDVGAVSEKLKGTAKCDGQGPVFEERTIIQAIENSVASGSDELM